MGSSVSCSGSVGASWSWLHLAWTGQLLVSSPRTQPYSLATANNLLWTPNTTLLLVKWVRCLTVFWSASFGTINIFAHCDYSSLLYDKLESFLVLLTRFIFFTVLFNSKHTTTHPACTLDPAVFQESFCLFWSHGDLGRGQIAGLLGSPIWKHSLLFLLKKNTELALENSVTQASSWISRSEH